MGNVNTLFKAPVLHDTPPYSLPLSHHSGCPLDVLCVSHRMFSPFYWLSTQYRMCGRTCISRGLYVAQNAAFYSSVDISFKGVEMMSKNSRKWAYCGRYSTSVQRLSASVHDKVKIWNGDPHTARTDYLFISRPLR